MFEKQYPDLEKKLYESKTLSNKISLLEQKLLISEKDQLQKNFINEIYN